MNIRSILLIVALSLAGCGQMAATGGSTALATGDNPGALNSLASQKGLSPNTADTFRFVVMSDRNGEQELGKWTQAVEEVNRLKPDFVMCIGDLAVGYNEDPAKLAAEWAEFEQENRNLQAPFFVTPGNHDVLGIEPRRQYEARHAPDGKTYYAFSYRECRFIVLDSTPLAMPRSATRPDPRLERHDDIAAAQWKWLEPELKQANASSRHVFIFFHHPLWDQPDVWAKLRPMLDASRTSLFAGHTHKLLYVVKDGIPCHNLAVTGAKGDGTLLSGHFQMFSWVTVDAGKPTVAHLTLGSVLPHDFMDLSTRDAIRDRLAPAQLSAVTAAGGNAALTLPNRSTKPAEYRIRWIGHPGIDAKSVQKIVVPPGKTGSQEFVIDAAAAAARPRILLETAVSSGGTTRLLTQEVPLPVVLRESAIRVSDIKLDGEFGDWTESMSKVAMQLRQIGPARLYLGRDDTNLYVGLDVLDDKIVIDAKQAWENDGIEIFWDPRPMERGGKFEGPCRQLLIPVPEAGKALQIQTSPRDNKPLLAAVRSAWKKTDKGYAIEIAIPLAALAPELQAGARSGRTTRMDIFVNQKDKPGGPVKVDSLSGKTVSSRPTGHYVLVELAE